MKRNFVLGRDMNLFFKFGSRLKKVKNHRFKRQEKRIRAWIDCGIFCCWGRQGVTREVIIAGKNLVAGYYQHQFRS
jgi:hypothetical protein